MNLRGFSKVGHWPSLLSAFLYFDTSFMVWVLLGALANSIVPDFQLNNAERGLMLAIPLLGGSILRLLLGLLTDHIGARRTGSIGLLLTLLPLLMGWVWADSFPKILWVGLLLGVAGASFAVALPLASRWYPPEYQGIALGVAGAGNSGTVLAALFGPSLAAAYGWKNVLGLAAVPLAVALIVYIICAKDAPKPPPAKGLLAYLSVLSIGDAWWFMFFYAVTFGGFSGLASSLTIYFNADYGLSPVVAGYFTAAAVFAGSLVRPVGGALADRVGGIRALSIMYIVAAIALALASFHLPQAWMALLLFIAGMLALGMGNGAVFQLVPQRFRNEIGVITGIVGMTGGIGGFYLASSLGYSKQLTGSYQFGLLIFAVLAGVAVVGLTTIKRRWRTTWGALGVSAARI